MKRLIIILILSMTTCLSTAQSQSDAILNLCSQINKDSLEYNVRTLQDFGSRYAFNDNRKQIAEYLMHRLENYGFETEIDSFYLEMEYPYNSGIINKTWQYNVVGKKQGLWDRGTTLHIGAHYDDVSFKEGFADYVNIAPGADDNASGVAGILEIARVFALNDIKPIKTLVINFFAAEEQGLIGSNHRIDGITQPTWKENIVGMINLDMIGYCTADSANYIANIITYDNSPELTEMAINFANLYTNLTPFETIMYNNASDSYSYYIYGVRSLFLSENEFTPHYHTERALFTTLNYDYMKQITMLAAAMTYECSVNNDYGTVSLKEEPQTEDLDLIIRNQPSEGEISYLIKGNSKHNTLSLYDLQGRKLTQIPLQTTESIGKIDVSSLQSGLYTLKLEGSNQAVSRKVIIVR